MKKRLLTVITVLALALAFAPAAFAEGEVTTIDEAKMYTIPIEGVQLPSDLDVTQSIVTEDGSPAFTDEAGIAVTYKDRNSRLYVRILAGLIKETAFSGSADLYLKVGEEQMKIARYVCPVLTAGTEMFGSVYTNGKSTLKAFFGGKMDFTPAALSVEGDGVDPAHIDGSKAVFTMLEGDGYYPDEYNVNFTGAFEFDGEGGRVAFNDGDITLNTGDYAITDPNSGREWSCLGGDGQGNYWYNMKVSGVKYNGLPVKDFTMKLHVYVYGFNYAADADALYGSGYNIHAQRGSSGESSKEETKWYTEGEQIVLCDKEADNIYIVWAQGINALSINEDDVKITLRSAYGDEKVLSDNDFTVFSSRNETQIAIKYINWAFIPVYTTMTVEVWGESMTYDIASVYVYEAQQGGGGTTVYGTVTAYSFYGFKNLTDVNQIMSPAKYILKTEIDGKTMYYAESNGVGSLVDTEAGAARFTARNRNQQLIGNTCYITSGVGKTDTRNINGTQYTFERVYYGGKLLTPDECDPALEPMDGYIIPKGTENWITNEKWAWQSAVSVGWTGIAVTPANARASWTMEAGTTQQFTANRSGVSWMLVGSPTSLDTKVDGNGVVTVGWDETGFFGVCAYVQGDDYARGTVHIKTTPAAGNRLDGRSIAVENGAGQTASIEFVYSGTPASSLRGIIDSPFDIVGVSSDYSVDFSSKNNSFIVYTADTFTSGATLFTVTVDMSKPVVSGSYKVGVMVLDATDENAADMEVKSSPATVIVSGGVEYAKGDLNLDGGIDNRDLIILARYLVKIETLTDIQLDAGDMSADGKVDNSDLVLLARYLVGDR